MLYAALVGVTARLLLAHSGMGRDLLAWRVEVSTAANSPLELQEGMALYRLGVSPYAGSSCRTPPLALWLYGTAHDLPGPAEDGSHNLVLHSLPNIAFDLVSALLLSRVVACLFSGSRSGAGPGALPSLVAWAYLLNPLSLATAAAGTTSPLEGMAVAAALYGSVVLRRRPAAATLGVAAAAYMSLHCLVLLLPVACLLAYGAEDVATPLRLLGPGSDPTSTGEQQQQQEQQHQHQQAEVEAEPAAATATGDQQQQQQQQQPERQPSRPKLAPLLLPEPGVEVEDTGRVAASASQRAAVSLLPWQMLARVGAMTAGWLLLLALLSELYLLPLSLPALSGHMSGKPSGAIGAQPHPPACLVAALEPLLLRPPWPPLSSLLSLESGTSSPHAPSLPARLAAVADGVAAQLRRRLAATRGSLASCWAARVYGSQLLIDDVAPNVGQWWYLAMEAFDDAKAYMRLLAHSLLFAMAPPLAIRLGSRRPVALFVVLLLALGLLKPYPSVADLGLAASLLPMLARQQLSVLRLGLLLPSALGLLCVLGPAMLRMWLSYESANSNFFYSMTLLYGVWQVLLLGQVLGLTLQVDRMARGKQGCTPSTDRGCVTTVAAAAMVGTRTVTPGGS